LRAGRKSRCPGGAVSIRADDDVGQATDDVDGQLRPRSLPPKRRADGPTDGGRTAKDISCTHCVHLQGSRAHKHAVAAIRARSSLEITPLRVPTSASCPGIRRRIESEPQAEPLRSDGARNEHVACTRHRIAGALRPGWANIQRPKHRPSRRRDPSHEAVPGRRSARLVDSHCIGSLWHVACVRPLGRR
jgi:hypothetical protein